MTSATHKAFIPTSTSYYTPSPTVPNVARPAQGLVLLGGATSVSSDFIAEMVMRFYYLESEFSRAVATEAQRLANQMTQEAVDKALAEAGGEVEIDYSDMTRAAQSAAKHPAFVLTDAERTAYEGIGKYELPFDVVYDEE